MNLKLRCIFAYRTVCPADLWIELVETIESLGHVSTKFNFNGNRRAPDDIATLLRSSNTSSFSVSNDRSEFHFCPIARYRLDQLTITADETVLGEPDHWVATLAASNILIQAFLFNREYDFWQNATDPLQYSARSRPHEHLPMKSNGLPPPLAQMVIDVSDNPGRWSLRNGYLEAVSSPIWLGDRFWALTLADRTKVLQSDLWLQVGELDDGVVCLRSHDGPFDSDKDVQRELQNQLRSLLYSNNC